jgi:beta-phosphoglucomutase-like phosphatase (HAD superfamily)
MFLLGLGTMKTEHIQAVIFDMDGLMLDSQRLATDAWQEAVASFGFQLTDEINLSMIGRNMHDSAAILRSAFSSQFPVDDVRELAARTFSQLTSVSGIPVKTGLWELLVFLDAESIPKAVATSTSRTDCIRHLKKANLISRFPVIVCGDEVTKGKPSPDLFLKAADKLEVKPTGCLVLEDSFPGIRAASAAGMIPIMVPDLKEADDEMRELAHAVVADLHEAKEVITQLLHGK